MKFTNHDQGPRYLNTLDGTILVLPGETSPDVELSEAELTDTRQARCDGSTRHRWGIDIEGDGKRERIFIATSDDADGSNFQLIDVGNARFVGVARGLSAPADPAAWQFQSVYEEAPAPEPDLEVVEKPLSKMNKAELTAKAAELGVDVPEGATNAEIVALIEAKSGTQATV